MNTDYTATRMLGYLYRISNPRPEDVVDEMLAILSDRNAIIQKKNWNMPRQRSTGYTGRDWNREENRTVICLKKYSRGEYEKVMEPFLQEIKIFTGISFT